MSRERRSGGFREQIKSAARESELLSKPAKAIASHYLNQVAFVVINSITFLLLWPFSWRSVIPETIVLVATILVCWKFIKIKKSRVVSLRLWLVGTGDLVDFAYTQYPDTIPWECVYVPKGQESSALRYAALLDRSLEFFAVGKTPEAISGLEACVLAIPTCNLQKMPQQGFGQFLAADVNRFVFLPRPTC